MFKAISTLVVCLLAAIPAAAQPIPIHGAPQGVSFYVNDLSQCPAGAKCSLPPWISGQCHWFPGNQHAFDVPGLPPVDHPPLFLPPMQPGTAHIHIQGKFPIWGELQAGPITIPIVMVLFGVDGELPLMQGSFLGPGGETPVSEFVPDLPLPILGNPLGVVTVTGHVTFDPSKAAIDPHGWFSVSHFGRLIFANKDRLDLRFQVPYFAMLDPSQPEPAPREGTQQFSAKCDVQSARDERPGGGVFGNHLTEFRGQDAPGRGYLPILAPFNTPQTIFPLTYSYSFEHRLPDTSPPFYELRLDSDFHMNREGKVIATTATELPGGGVSNVDVLDPVVIAASTAPMGVTPGKHRLSANWVQPTGPGIPGLFAPNEQLTSLVAWEVEIGANPIPADPPPPVVTVTVPSVLGLPQSSAQALLTNAHLTMGTVSLVTNPASAGTVILQTPSGGATVATGSAVSLVVSNGPVVTPPPTTTWPAGTYAFVCDGVPLVCGFKFVAK